MGLVWREHVDGKEVRDLWVRRRKTYLRVLSLWVSLDSGLSIAG